MTFRVLLTPSARRALAVRLPESAGFAVLEFLSGPLADATRRVGAPLRPPFEGQWRARRGEYRVRYRFDETSHVVYVLDVDHRRDIYPALRKRQPRSRTAST